MYEGKVGRAYGRGCFRSCVVAPLGALFGVAMVTTVLLVIRGGDVEPRSGRLGAAMLPIWAALFLFAWMRVGSP